MDVGEILSCQFSQLTLSRVISNAVSIDLPTQTRYEIWRSNTYLKNGDIAYNGALYHLLLPLSVLCDH